jgi:hypothetical protein
MQNPDLGGAFPQLIPSLNKGQHTAIPRNEAELGDPTNISDHVQAIANTAAFHFAFVEEGGSSLYPTLAQKVSNLEVLRILLSIGPTETAHFQTWHDKAGNAPNVTDGSLVFPDLNAPAFQGEDRKKNLIMPEPCQFISEKLPPCSIIRPTGTRSGAPSPPLKVSGGTDSSSVKGTRSFSSCSPLRPPPIGRNGSYE